MKKAGRSNINIFNEEEYMNTCRRFNIKPSFKESRLEFENGDFFERMKNLISIDRRGEVVFCVVRPNGNIITTTCKGYPDGIYRIPTGGLGYKENIVDAVYREVKEELGLEVEILKFGGVIKITLTHENENLMFYSYLFILKEKGGRLLLDALDNEISDTKEVSAEQFFSLVEKLNNIEGRWKDWGKFRYITSKAVLDLIY